MCMAVGTDSYRGVGFAEAWEGGEWKIKATQGTEMNAVSCVSATWCMAIGKFTTGDAWQFETFEVLHGSWIVEARTPPTPKGATEFDLSSISCTSESACTATGYYSAEERVKTLAYRWNGSSWSQQNTLNPSEGGAGEAMLSVSCASASLCMAVGEAASKPFAEV